MFLVAVALIFSQNGYGKLNQMMTMVTEWGKRKKKKKKRRKHSRKYKINWLRVKSSPNFPNNKYYYYSMGCLMLKIISRTQHTIYADEYKKSINEDNLIFDKCSTGYIHTQTHEMTSKTLRYFDMLKKTRTHGITITEQNLTVEPSF